MIKSQKESACGCAGVFSAHAAIELYAEAFDRANKIDMLEGFASYFGPDFYGLRRNIETITWKKPLGRSLKALAFQDSKVIPFFAGEELSWRLRSLSNIVLKEQPAFFDIFFDLFFELVK